MPEASDHASIMLILSNAWEVLLLFLIPIGGGIPAGVILAHNKGFDWPTISLLYLISDIILALLFEPILKVFRWLARRIESLARFIEVFKKSIDQSIAKFGVSPSPITLIMISFVIDPMTGRTAALAAGHGFFIGWTFAILGDMIFFLILMISTLYLNSILGDGNAAALIITMALMAVHYLVKRFKKS